uniref:Nuclear receptor domain-containing protein n=1 Tax=Steinernema glaseri TaxID=37863 RepID=A0A1I7YRK6_9BILA
MLSASTSSSSDTGEECMICGAPPHGLHYGVYTCRACAAFFRRTLASGREYKCRKGSKNCTVSKDVANVCRCCRFLKCRRMGMSFNEPAEHSSFGSHSPSVSRTTDESSYQVSPITIENHKIVYDINPFLALIGNMLTGAPTRFDPPLSPSVRYPPLQRLHLALPTLFSEPAYTSGQMREVLLIDIVEALQEMEKSIYRTAKFIMSCKEFVKLPLSDKVGEYQLDMA